MADAESQAVEEKQAGEGVGSDGGDDQGYEGTKRSDGDHPLISATIQGKDLSAPASNQSAEQRRLTIDRQAYRRRRQQNTCRSSSTRLRG